MEYEYTILTVQHVDANTVTVRLVKLVENRLANGWKLTGGVALVWNGALYTATQAMWRGAA